MKNLIWKRSTPSSENFVCRKTINFSLLFTQVVDKKVGRAGLIYFLNPDVIDGGSAGRDSQSLPSLEFVSPVVL